MRKAALMVLIPLSVAQAPGQQSTGGDHPQFSLADCVNEFSSAAVESTAVGYQYWFVDRDFLDGRTIKMSVVRPHEATHAPHTHGEDEFFVVLEGRAELILEDERRVVGPLTSFYCPPSTMHGIRNAGETDLKYLVIKKYRRPNQTHQ